MNRLEFQAKVAEELTRLTGEVFGNHPTACTVFCITNSLEATHNATLQVNFAWDRGEILIHYLSGGWHHVFGRMPEGGPAAVARKIAFVYEACGV